MKILVIENEYWYIETSFRYVNEIYFNNELKIEQIERSQEISSFHDLTNYDLIFLDISLSINSTLDGFGIMKKMQKDGIPLDNIIILTGNHLIEQKLNDHGISNNIDILTKPVDIKDLQKIIEKYKK